MLMLVLVLILVLRDLHIQIACIDGSIWRGNLNTSRVTRFAAVMEIVGGVEVWMYYE